MITPFSFHRAVPAASGRTRRSLAAFTALGLAFTLAACDEEMMSPQLESQDASYSLTGETLVANAQRIPASIDASGSRDVSKEMQEFLASVPDGSTIVFPAGAKYRMEETLILTDRNNLTFEGNGASIISNVSSPFGYTLQSLVYLGDTIQYNVYSKENRSRQHIRIIGGSNYVFRNLTIRGPHTAGGTTDAAYVEELEAQHGIDARGVNGLELDHVTIKNVYGDFLYITHRGMVRGTIGPWSENIRVHDSRFEKNGRQGMAVNGASNVVFERNYLGNVRRSHFDFEPNARQEGARDVVIRNNTFGPGRLNFLSSAGAAGMVEGITVESNQFVGKNMVVAVRPQRGGARRNFRFINNISDNTYGSPQALMTFYYTDGIEVRGNRNALKAGRGMTAVYTETSCNLTVESNEFTNAGQLTQTVGTCE